MTLRRAPEPVRNELPPSCKLVWRELDALDGATQRDLVDETQLPKRTVRYALRRLEESGAIRWDWSVSDARQKVYYACSR